MRKLGVAAAIAAPALAALPTPAKATPVKVPSQPNIVLIYADDIGYGDIGCYGAKGIPTPNIDRLAETGLRFTSGYAPSATCTPSRSALLTGEYAFRRPGTSILDGDAGLIITPGRQALPAMLKGAGYNTAVIGKWHLGLGGAAGPNWNGQSTPNPQHIGFDYHFVFPATADRVPTVFVEDGRVVNLDPHDPITVDYRKPVDDGPTGAKNPEMVRMKSNGPQHNGTIVNGIPRIGFMSGGQAALWKDEELAETFTQRAAGWLSKQSADKPFFLFFPTHNNHVPRAPDPRFVGATSYGARGDAVVEFDWMVGEVLRTLDKLKLRDNTLIIVSSDNGPVVSDGYFDGAARLLDDHKPAGPFRGGKYGIQEGSVRAPFVVNWPKHIAPTVSDAIVSQVDLLASLATLTGQTLDRASAPDSQDLLPVFLGQSGEGRSELVEHARGQMVALRSGKWKFIPGEKPQLYDVVTDLGEAHNVAALHPEITATLAARLQQLHSAKP